MWRKYTSDKLRIAKQMLMDQNVQGEELYNWCPALSDRSLLPDTNDINEAHAFKLHCNYY
jgi:hypothetical protein